MSTIRVEGLDRVKANLAMLIDPKTIAEAVKEAAAHVMGKAKAYPPKQHITMKQIGGWASEKQRRFVMAAIREGLITIPYQRGAGSALHPSKQLQQKWTIEMRNRGFTAVIGNNVTYARFVQGPDDQSRMHKAIGWKTTDQIADQEREKVVRMINESVAKVIKGMK